jgi:mono/diheme cytochrome c family protein
MMRFVVLNSPMKKSIAAIALLAATCVWANAPAPPPDPADEPAPMDMSPPTFDLSEQAHIDAGKVRFGTNCAAYCHGFEGSGGRTPAFKGRKDLDAQEVFKIISIGRKGADIMPAWGNGFTADKRWELVAYIMYLTRQPAPAE